MNEQGEKAIDILKIVIVVKFVGLVTTILLFV